MRRSIAAGNWKMNGLRENFNDILLIDAASENVNCDVILCVPDTLIREMSEKQKIFFPEGKIVTLKHQVLLLAIFQRK